MAKRISRAMLLCVALAAAHEKPSCEDSDDSQTCEASTSSAGTGGVHLMSSAWRYSESVVEECGELWANCKDTKCCVDGLTCWEKDPDGYAQCRTACSDGWTCKELTPDSPAPTPAPPTVSPTAAPTQVPTNTPTECGELWANCKDTKCCVDGLTCWEKDPDGYAQCRTACKDGWTCKELTPDSPAPSPTPPIAPPKGPKRLIVQGRKVFIPDDMSKEFFLRGFNMWFGLPSRERTTNNFDEMMLEARNRNGDSIVNHVRLVMVHWMDYSTGNNDCKTNDKTQGYLKSECIDMFDGAISWTTKNKLWATITVRAANAADDQNDPNFWNRPDLREQLADVHAFLADRYKDVDYIAGYEVLSEPRTQYNDEVTDLHRRACPKIWKADPEAVCFTGSGPFYRRDHMEETVQTYPEPQGKLIYAVNFFAPHRWIMHEHATYGVVYNSGKDELCDHLCFRSYCVQMFPECNGRFNCAASKRLKFNRAGLDLMIQPILNFQKVHDAPIWVDQWGAEFGDTKDRWDQVAEYVTDVQSLFLQYNLHSAYWIWRRTPSYSCDRFHIVCDAQRPALVRDDVIANFAPAPAPDR